MAGRCDAPPVGRAPFFCSSTNSISIHVCSKLLRREEGVLENFWDTHSFGGVEHQTPKQHAEENQTTPPYKISKYVQPWLFILGVSYINVNEYS